MERRAEGGLHDGPPSGAPERRVSDASVGAELPGLLAERGLTYRTLAGLVGVTHTHLVRIVHERGRRATGELAARIAVVLALPEDYFPETREAVVLEAVRSDPAYRDHLYESMAAPKGTRRGRRPARSRRRRPRAGTPMGPGGFEPPRDGL